MIAIVENAATAVETTPSKGTAAPHFARLARRHKDARMGWIRAKARVEAVRAAIPPRGQTEPIDDAREAVAVAREVGAANRFWEAEEALVDAIREGFGRLPVLLRVGGAFIVAEGNLNLESHGGTEVNLVVADAGDVIDLGDAE